jgi:hypothetical protein
LCSAREKSQFLFLEIHSCIDLEDLDTYAVGRKTASNRLVDPRNTPTMDARGSSTVVFKDKTIEELLKMSFKDPSKTKLSQDAVKLTSEYARIFVLEILSR